MCISAILSIFIFKNRIGVTSITFVVNYSYSAFLYKVVTLLLDFHCPMLVHRKLNDLKLTHNREFLKHYVAKDVSIW